MTFIWHCSGISTFLVFQILIVAAAAAASALLSSLSIGKKSILCHWISNSIGGFQETEDWRWNRKDSAWRFVCLCLYACVKCLAKLKNRLPIYRSLLLFIASASRVSLPSILLCLQVNKLASVYLCGACEGRFMSAQVQVFLSHRRKIELTHCIQVTKRYTGGSALREREQQVGSVWNMADLFARLKCNSKINRRIQRDWLTNKLAS